MGSSTRAKVLMVHDYPPVSGGGLALAVQELAQQLRNEFLFDILSSRLSDHFADDRSRRRDTVTRNGDPRWALAAPRRTVRWLMQADVIVIHWTFSFRCLSTLFLALVPFLRQPTACVIHTAPDHCRYNRLQWLPASARSLLLALARLGLRRCASVVALSQTHSAALSDAGIASTHVLPFPVTPTSAYDDAYRKQCQERRAPTTIGIVGELSRLKGADTIPMLLASLTPEFAFRIVGSGPLSRWLARSVDTLPASQRTQVRLSARVEPADMAGYYRGEVDCLLILSRTESQCRVALEAMLAGVIVLARLTSGVKDLVMDGVTGFLVDPDDPEAVRRVLRHLADDPAEADAIRSRARTFAEWTFRESCRRWHGFLNELADRALRIG